MNILLIEDDIGLVELITEKLEELGFSVMSATSGAEALAHHKKQTPDLILLDYSLPDMNGKELVEKFNKQQTPSPPFIITTGHGDERIAVDMMKLGAMDYLVKDILFLEKLPNVVKRVIKEIESEGKLRQAEEALKESEEIIKTNLAILKTAGETAKFGGWSVTIGENRVFWSDQVAIIHERPTGYSPLVEEAINYYAPEFIETITRVFTNCIEKGIAFNEELQIITAKGNRIWVRATGDAIKEKQGNIVKVLGSFQDINNSKLAEQELKRNRDHLEEIVQARTEELEEKNKDLKRFNKLFIDREFRIKELRDELKKYKE
jgi:PAS domain S-box-containing protein